MEGLPNSSSDQSWYKPRGYAQAMNSQAEPGNNASNQPLAHQTRSKLTKAQVGRAATYSPGSKHTRPSDSCDVPTGNIKRPEASHNRRERRREPVVWDNIPLDDRPGAEPAKVTSRDQQRRQDMLPPPYNVNVNAKTNANTQPQAYYYYPDPQNPRAIVLVPVQQEQAGYPRTTNMAATREDGGAHQGSDQEAKDCCCAFVCCCLCGCLEAILRGM